MNECEFYHCVKIYNKFCHVTCKIVLPGSDFFDNRNYDHGFFHNITHTEYYITCELLPDSSIENMLNKKTYGIDYIDIYNSEQKERLSIHQKRELEQYLKRILPFYLTHHISNREIRMYSDRNLNSPYGHNTQTISIGDSQTNLYNSFPKQIGVGYCTNNVTSSQQGNFNSIPQQIPKRPGNNGNANSFCGNIGNNEMTTQAVSITNSQGNGFLQSINSFSTSAAPQNRVIHNVTNSQHIIDREMGSNNYENINSFHRNIVNNTPLTQSVLTTDFNHGNDSQNVNGTRNYAYTWQQVDLVDFNNNYRDTGNNVMKTQANGLMYDYQDINGIHQVTQSQQQVDFNNNCENLDLHNENIENNITTTQANGLTYDYHHINNNYRATDSHNENIENNITTTQANDQVNLINNNYEDTDWHNSNIVMTTQINSLTCDRQDVNDTVHQVTRC
ncbi:unnamed protein product [Rhizophagus irregularis]|uniref:Uncharacterized protein n=1 Tax=Rhizophagus irregularis TaxID=588596 RepID=A0A2N1NZ47_9GLOM|nr:hypothetical protein RhiirC2_860801 [Rhizophagus irregularis]CAB4374971.1 unnamed protein product [Rhizophagus irregularis]CAB5368899.1 unnamed protein product [Rhizophagus irregularis]